MEGYDDSPSWLDEALDGASYQDMGGRGASRSSTNKIMTSTLGRQSYLPRLSQIPTKMTMRQSHLGESSPDPNQPAWAQEPQDLDTSGLSVDGSSSGLPAIALLGENNDEERCCICYDPILCPFWILHGLTALVGAGTIVVNVMTITDVSEGVMPILLRSYAVLFGLLVIFVEIDCGYVLEYCKALELWAIRGLFYVFVAVETVRSDDAATGVRAESVMGGLLGALGLIYFVMGICCIQHVKSRRLLLLGRPREGYTPIKGSEGSTGRDQNGSDGERRTSQTNGSGLDAAGDATCCRWWNIC